jgi:nitroreductase/NAD-dependent dihydropyrimidine dehydrogenase PreA subunit
MIHIDEKKCTKCRFCVDECPARIFVVNTGVRSSPVTESAHLAQCNRCGHCVAICPTDAITHDELPSDGFNVISNETINPDALHAFMLSRRSTRSFKEKPVPRELIERLIEVGTHAGTASNLQSEGFIVMQDYRLIDDLEKLVLETLWKKMRILSNSFGRRLARFKYGEVTSRQAISYFERFRTMRHKGELRGSVFRSAPAVILIHGERSNRSVHENCAIAARNMELLAQSLGLGTCWAGFLLVAAGMDSRITGHLGIAANRNIFGALMLGYPVHSYRKTVPRRKRDVRWM